LEVQHQRLRGIGVLVEVSVELNLLATAVQVDSAGT